MASRSVGPTTTTPPSSDSTEALREGRINDIYEEEEGRERSHSIQGGIVANRPESTSNLEAIIWARGLRMADGWKKESSSHVIKCNNLVIIIKEEREGETLTRL